MKAASVWCLVLVSTMVPGDADAQQAPKGSLKYKDGTALDLLAKKALENPALDEGTVLQIRFSVSVGDPNSTAPARAYVETKGDLKHAPEALLWLVVRSLTDVDGLHVRSQQVGGLGVQDYVRLLGSRASGRPGASPSGSMWRRMLPAMKLVRRKPPRSDLSLVLNLVDGGVSGMKWIGMVHLQGPVGDVAHLFAPWLVWDHLDRVLPPKGRSAVNAYMKTLAQAAMPWEATGPVQAARWVDKTIKAGGR